MISVWIYTLLAKDTKSTKDLSNHSRSIYMLRHACVQRSNKK